MRRFGPARVFDLQTRKINRFPGRPEPTHRPVRRETSRTGRRAYTLTFAVLVLFGSTLGGRFGRRMMFVTGLGVFTAASAGAAPAPAMGDLIPAPAAQGVGAGILTPVTLTLLAAAVSPERRGAALDVRGAASGIAVATRPLIGGTLTEQLSWPWIFWVNVSIGLVLLPLALLRLCPGRHPVAAERHRLDAGSVVVQLAAAGKLTTVTSSRRTTSPQALHASTG